MTEYNLREINESPKVESAYLWDFDNMNLSLAIEHGKFVIAENYVVLLATASKGNGFKQKENYKWKWEAGDIRYVALTFWQKPRQEQDFKTKEKKTIEPHPIELVIGKIAAEVGDADFKGDLRLLMSGMMHQILSGKREDGSDLPPEFMSMMIDSVLKLDFIETPEGHPWTPDIVEKCLPKDKSGGFSRGYGGSKSQTETERLLDREKWFVAAVHGFCPDSTDRKSFSEVAAYLAVAGSKDSSIKDFIEMTKIILN